MLHWPLDDPQWEELDRARPSLIVLANSRTLLREGEPFVRALLEIRERLGARPLLWAPRVAVPHRLPWLFYVGVDLVDTTETVWRATEGEYFDLVRGSADPGSDPDARSCLCLACRGSGPVDRVAHGLALLEQQRREASRAIAIGQLRELVEARLSAEPLLSEVLRYTDRHLARLLEERTPVTGGPIRTYVLNESRRRPEVRRYLSRLSTEYRPPSSKDVLLLVPCSKTKPYHNSRSHRRFRTALDGLAGESRIHVVSVTSPLAVVPRELEDLPPARHYDIPVTGEWDVEEQRSLGDAVRRLANSGTYRRALVHLDHTEYSFLEGALPKELAPVWTVADGSPTSDASLSRLRSEARSALSNGATLRSAGLPSPLPELAAMAAVQLGRERSDRLFAPPVRLLGRPWFWRLQDGSGRDLASWREARGLLHLTVAGADRAGLPMVQVKAGVPLFGDLFVPGVEAADGSIRAGDSVALTRDGRLVAVGEARLPGRLMAQLDQGLAVEIRHRSRDQAGGPKGP